MCSMTSIDNMMPAEGVYAILGLWKTAASNRVEVEALLSPLSSTPMQVSTTVRGGRVEKKSHALLYVIVPTSL